MEIYNAFAMKINSGFPPPKASVMGFAESRLQKVYASTSLKRNGWQVNNYTGSLPSSWANVFFNNAFVSPYPTIDVGLIAEDIKDSLKLFTTRIAGSTVNNITTTVDGMYINYGTPKNIRPFVNQTLPWTISRSGSANITGKVTVTVDGHNIGIDFIGIRSVVFSLRPNWKDPVRVNYDFLSDTYESYDGTETIASLREYPRSDLNFSYFVSREEEPYWSNRLDAYQGSYIVPAWHDPYSLAEPVGPEDLVVVLDRPLREGAQGNGASSLLLAGKVLTIDSYEGNVVTLQRRAGVNVGPGTEVVVTHSCFIAEGVQVSRLTTDLSTYTINFIKDSDSDEFYTPEPPEMIWGWPLLKFNPNRMNEISDNLTPRLVAFDNETGFRKTRARTRLPSRIYAANFTFFSQDEINSFKDFMLYTRGQQTPFWLDTGNTDFYVVEDILSGATKIRVKNLGYSQFKFPKECYRQLVIVANGVKTYVRVTDSFIINDDIEELTILDSQVPEIKAYNIERVSQVMPVRWSTDNFSFNYRSTEVAEISKGVKLIDYFTNNIQ